MMYGTRYAGKEDYQEKLSGAGVASMTHRNPWFIITNDEIEAIHTRLQDFRNDLSGPGLSHVRDIDNLLQNIRDRRP